VCGGGRRICHRDRGDQEVDASGCDDEQAEGLEPSASLRPLGSRVRNVARKRAVVVANHDQDRVVRHDTRIVVWPSKVMSDAGAAEEERGSRRRVLASACTSLAVAAASKDSSSEASARRDRNAGTERDDAAALHLARIDSRPAASRDRPGCVPRLLRERPRPESPDDDQFFHGELLWGWPCRTRRRVTPTVPVRMLPAWWRRSLAASSERRLGPRNATGAAAGPPRLRIGSGSGCT
jgi:hypothetical protein